MASVKKVRNIIFLKDVLVLAISAFGGPQAHIAMLFERMVKKHNYVTEEELIELNALCTLLPGPTSTQTITAIGYKIGGANLAYLTLLVWILPAGTFMTAIGIYISHMQSMGLSIEFTKYIQPMAVGIIAYAGYKISSKVVSTKTGIILMFVSAIVSYLVSINYGHQLISAITFPVLLIFGGVVTSFKYHKQPKIKNQTKGEINWSNFLLFIAVFVVAASISGIAQLKFVSLFENFYRNGSLIFGGGQVLIPLLKAQFVDYKHYLTDAEFLSGIGFTQAMPGPVFSLSGYIGALSVREYGVWGQIIGGFVALVGVFLPGTFLIFFVYGFWNRLKEYRPIRASIEGVNAVGSGLVICAAFLLLDPSNTQLGSTIGLINIGIIIGTFLIMYTEKVPSPFLIIAALVAGFVF